jgi:ligand-binding sensor domain-containing protein
MKVYCFLFLLLIISCKQTENNSEPKTLPSESTEKENLLQKAIPNKIIEGDPSFVIQKDTVSTIGPKCITRDIIMDKKGSLWFATWQGIINFDGKYFTNITLKEGLRRYHIQISFEDSKGNLWFGTIDGGIFFYDGQNFGYYTKNDGLVGNKVFCFMEDKAGKIWIGTNEGLSCKNGNSFMNFNKQSGLNDDFIYAIAEDNNGRIWIGTNNGISCCSERILPGQRSFFDFHINENHSFHTVRSILNDRNGKIWIASQEGLFRYTPTANESEKGKLEQISPLIVMNLFEDKTGNLWLSTTNKNSNMMSLIKYDGMTFSEISNHIQVFGVCEDPENNIWFGTERGTYKYEGK